MDQVVTTGMILSATPIGEYDRRVVILTKEYGKIAAFARGARRPNSSLVGVTSPFTFGKFTLYKGRSSYTLQGAEIDNYFEELRTDIVGAYYGLYFLEFASYCTREENDEREVLKLLYQSLKALTNEHIPDKLVRYVFEFKMYYITGIGPEVSGCLTCGNTEGQLYFSPVKGGIVCDECKAGIPDKVMLLQSTLYTLQYIQSSTIQKLYTFTVKEDVLKQLQKISDRYRQIHIDKEFNSIEILETLEGF